MTNERPLPFMWGNLTQDMLDEITAFCQGRTVWDFGAGVGALSLYLAAYGAKKVIAIEKRSELKPEIVDQMGDLVDWRTCTFKDINLRKEQFDVALFSWLEQHQALAELLVVACKAHNIIYRGCNFQGTVCAPPRLFQSFLLREIESFQSSGIDTMIIYGKQRETPRELIHAEEFAGILNSTTAIISLWETPQELRTAEQWAEEFFPQNPKVKASINFFTQNAKKHVEVVRHFLLDLF